VRSDTAMTGEITLSGLVLPVGGIKGKVLAARRSGMKRVVLPKKNEADLKDIPEEAMRDLEVVLVERINELLPQTLIPSRKRNPRCPYQNRNLRRQARKCASKWRSSCVRCDGRIGVAVMYTELFETIYPINTKKEKGVVVTAVDPFALGDRLGIQPGDRIVKVNGRDLHDFLDFQFYTGSEDCVRLEIVKKSGEAAAVETEVGEGEIWGLDFEYFSPRQCANDCIFCFCNQNLPAHASLCSLRTKIRGCRFFTATTHDVFDLKNRARSHCRAAAVATICLRTRYRSRSSPLSARPQAPDDVLGKMRYLAANGIELHAQIVLCPSINDGQVLKRTIDDLAELHPGLRSVAVVPVVFTRLHNYRDRMTAVTEAFAKALIKEVRQWQREFRRQLGTTFVFLADEFYLRAGVSLPGRAHYGDYPQIEDGVGMVRRFVVDAKRTLSHDLVSDFQLRPGSLRGTIATGELFYPILAQYVDQINRMCGTRLKISAIRNRFLWRGGNRGRADRGKRRAGGPRFDPGRVPDRPRAGVPEVRQHISR
jgi:putative radical SAM enzyme (TIGR03279 family)